MTSHLHVFEIPIDGAVEAFAVDGTPADSVGVALKSSLLRTRDFDLVVSGINRGDNVGLHVLYSGTVGAAREATCRGYPAIAFSLASHRARSEEDYAQAAGCAVAFIKVGICMYSFCMYSFCMYSFCMYSFCMYVFFLYVFFLYVFSYTCVFVIIYI